MGESGQIITRTYQPGETIIREGEPGNHVFLIISGSVDVYKTVEGNRQLITVLGSGEIFGEMGPLTNEPRFATVVSAEETRLIMVQDQTFHNALLNDRLPIIKPLAKQLVLRLKAAECLLQESQKRIKQLEAELAHFQSRQDRHDPLVGH